MHEALESAAVCIAGAVTVGALVTRRWSRLYPAWPPAPQPPADDAATAEDPYRSVPSSMLDARLVRAVPRVARAATVAALVVGQIALVAAFAGVLASTVLAMTAVAREDLLLAKSGFVAVGVAFAAAVYLLRVGPTLLRAGEHDAAPARLAAAWTMGLGVLLFALDFGVLGGALGHHEAWLALTLLGASLSSIATSFVLGRAVDALTGEDV